MRNLLCYLCLFVGLTLNAAKHRELGEVDWLRNYDAAVTQSKESGKPICLLFQEVPGCQGCVNYGQETLSHPLIVDAIEEAFVPLAIFNNKGGHDKEILKRFKEPAWNFQVMRFIRADGKDIIPRKDQVWSVDATARRMVEALEAAKQLVPKYLQSLVLAGDKGLNTGAFSMYCFWSGEANLGGVDGVIETEAGWMHGREVVKLKYDPSRVQWKMLVKQAKAFGYKEESYKPKDYRIASKSDQKRYLNHSKLKKLKLNPVQATKVNAALATGDTKELLSWLSPSQRKDLR